MTPTVRHGRPRGMAILALGALMSLTAIAYGHRAPGSISRIDWNPRSGQTEITHRLHVHDAAVGVAEVEGLGRLDLSSLEGRARAALYVEARFALELDGAPVRLRTLGAELRDDYLLVYQETDQPLLGRLRVASDILRDAFDGQVNEVNVRVDGSVRTLRFTGEDRWQKVATGETQPAPLEAGP